MLVYKITNTVNDRVYIGITSCSLQKRWREHKCAANKKSNKPLYRAMRAYGIDKFSIEQIYVASSEEDMRSAEIRYIAEYKSHCNERGYNLTDHGFRYGSVSVSFGEKRYNAVLTEEMVSLIRNPEFQNISNKEMLLMVSQRFGFTGSRDAVRDARRGDTWAHLNEKCAPIKCGQGARKPQVRGETREAAVKTLAAHHAEAIKKSAEMRVGKRGKNAKLSVEAVKQIFFNNDTLAQTARDFGISKKMVSLIKQRKAHVYLTQGL